MGAGVDSQKSLGSPGAGEPETDGLAARLEPFDSYWQAPDDPAAGYDKFYEYYRYNFFPHVPDDREQSILVVSCGPGYLVRLLADRGYTEVLGIDSDPEKIRYARERDLNCRVEAAFPYLEKHGEAFDTIICEQELNHLTKSEMVRFLKLCRGRLSDGGTLIVYGLNGANPITGSEAFAQNFDHFNMFTEYSLKQVLELVGFREIEPFPLKLYVFYKNPLNYVGMAVTGALSLFFRLCFKLYGKNNRIFSKKIAAVCRK